jgi:hypothetical protein
MRSCIICTHPQISLGKSSQVKANEVGGTWGDWLGGCGLDSTGSGQGTVAGCWEWGDEPSGSCATELDTYYEGPLKMIVHRGPGGSNPALPTCTANRLQFWDGNICSPNSAIDSFTDYIQLMPTIRVYIGTMQYTPQHTAW